jgi:hypothetical protein
MDRTPGPEAATPRQHLGNPPLVSGQLVEPIRSETRIDEHAWIALVFRRQPRCGGGAVLLAVGGHHRFLSNRTGKIVEVDRTARPLLPGLPATIPPYGVLVISDEG